MSPEKTSKIVYLIPTAIQQAKQGENLQKINYLTKLTGDIVL